MLFQFVLLCVEASERFLLHRTAQSEQGGDDLHHDESSDESWRFLYILWCVFFSIGFLCVIQGFCGILHLNWRYSRIIKWVQAAKGIVVADVDPDRVDSHNDGALVHVRGHITCEDIMDPDLGVSVSNCYKLVRQVSMYQYLQPALSSPSSWFERRATWVNGPVKNAGNPEFKLKQDKWIAENFKMGEYKIPVKFIESMIGVNIWAYRHLLDDQVQLTWDGQPLYSVNGTLKSRIEGDPQVGDLQIQYIRYDVGTATAIAMQSGDSLFPVSLDSSITDSGRIEQSEVDPFLADSPSRPVVGIFDFHLSVYESFKLLKRIEMTGAFCTDAWGVLVSFIGLMIISYIWPSMEIHSEIMDMLLTLCDTWWKCLSFCLAVYCCITGLCYMTTMPYKATMNCTMAVVISVLLYCLIGFPTHSASVPNEGF